MPDRHIAHPGLEQGIPYELAHEDWHEHHGEEHTPPPETED